MYNESHNIVSEFEIEHYMLCLVLKFEFMLSHFYSKKLRISIECFYL